MAHTHNTHSFRFPLAPLTLAISSALVLMAQPAMAENANVELEQIEIVDSAEAGYTVDDLSNPKYTQKLVDTPKTINVINEAVLEDQGVTSLEDALRNISGVSTFGAGEGGGNINTADNVTIRGFDANGSIYTDGIRDVAGYSRDTFNTESIEVAKGANGTISGKGSAGGSVNLVTKTAHLRGDKNSVTASYDESDTTRITGDFNKVLTEDSAIRLNIVGQTGGDYWDNGEENYETEAIALSYFDKLSEKTDLTVNFMHMQQDNTPVLGLPYITEDAAAAGTGLTEGPLSESYYGNYYGVEGLDFEEVEATTITTILNHQINDKWAFRNQTRFGQTETKSIVTRPWAYSSNSVYTGEYTNQYTKDDFSDSQLIVSQFDFIGELYTGAIRHDLVIGSEIYQEKETTYDADTTSLTYSQTTYDPLNPGTTTVTGSYSLDEIGDATGTGLAVYANDTATLNDKIQVSGGLRLEKYKLDYSEADTGFSADSDSDLVSWSTAINYKLAPNGSVYAAIGNSQTPHGTDLSLEGRSDAQKLEYLSLDPLESSTTEVGTKWNLFNDRLLLSSAIFKTTADTYDTNDDSEAIFGEEQSTGFELSATGQLTKTVSVTASYTKQDTEVTEDNSSDNVGDGLSSAPDKSAALWFAYNKEKLGLGIGAEYNSGINYWRQSEVIFNSGSVTLFNAMASYQFTENLSAQLNISNLTDENYLTDYSVKGSFLPGYGRNAKATVKYDF